MNESYLYEDQLLISAYHPAATISEEEYGTCIYTKKPINLINYIDKLNIDYIILNSFNIDNDTFSNVLDNYINNKTNNDDNYLGFLKEKTIYKVKDNE